MEKLYGGIEAGGTKFVCVIGTGIDQIDCEVRFLTTSPEETIQRVIHFFQPYKARGSLAAIGIGSFGPIDLDKNSSTYGFITSTPKPGWSNTDLCGTIRNSLKTPIVFDTDVNAAAFGELSCEKSSKNMDPFIYITVGTGIGVGVIVNGIPVHGLVHAEAGHMFIPHDIVRDPFPGICPFHKDCWEGLASGPSMKERWGISGQEIPDDHPAWDVEARYNALAIANLILTYSPYRIVFGGGVSEHHGLIEKVRSEVLDVLNGYVRSPQITEAIDNYLILPRLGNQSGSLGALALAKHYMVENPFEKR